MGGANTGGGGGNSNQVSGYEAEITKQRRQQSNAINTDQKVGTYGDTKTGRTFGGEYSKENQNPAKDNATSLDNLKYEGSKAPSLIGKTLDAIGIAEKTFEVNKAYYKKNVVGKNNFTESPDDFKSYMNKRGRGEVDAMGRAISGGGDGGGNTQPGIKKNIGGSTIQTTAPTEAEVSQSEAANADAAALKVKKRGRSQSIMTSSKGVTKTAANYSLGKPSLLGQV